MVDNYPDSLGRPVKNSVSPPVEKFVTVKAVNKDLFDVAYTGYYPFEDLEVGHAFFVPNNKGVTTNQSVEKMNKNIVTVRRFYSEVEVDESGDEVWEEVIVKTATRDDDGNIMLDSSGKPLIGANPVTRPKLIGSRHYIVYPIVKDYDIGDGQKAKDDGILVVRVV